MYTAGVDTIDAGQRKTALVNELALPVSGEQIHGDIDRLRTDRQVHRAADGRNRIHAARVPVRQIPGGRNLERTQQTDVEMTAAQHPERILLLEIGGTGEDVTGNLPALIRS